MSEETTEITTTFTDLGLSKPVLDALKKVGYETPSPIQAAAIPVLMTGCDIIGQAQTGTGKTAAFALPILSQIDAKLNEPQVLVLAPTRELAIQVAEAFQTYASCLKNFHVLPVYGGQDIVNQLKQLKRGPQIVVGTPGRLLDHLRRKSLKLDHLKVMVLDEADEMLRMGFIDDVETILSHTSGDQQTALFSATLPEPIRRVSQRFLTDPKHIKIESKATTVDTIDQSYLMVSGMGQKMDAITRILEVEDFDGIIIFVRTRGATTELTEKIIARGHSCAAINGDMSQNIREKTISQLKNGKIDILVATDVAARGLDVQRISHVINYDIPYDAETYVHRIGRTGRAGRLGKAILFVANRERRMLQTIERTTRKPIDRMTFPSSAEMAAQRKERFKETLIEAIAETPKPFFDDLISELTAELECDAQQIAASFAYMLQKDRPLEVAPEPKHKPRQDRDRDRDRDSRRDSRDGGRDSRRDSRPGSRDSRPSRDSRGQGDSKPRESKRRASKVDPSIVMQKYRLEVGREHSVTPGDIVGAIANEADIDSAYIGGINIQDDYSTVELPGGMPKEVFDHLKKVRVRNHPIQISIEGKGAPSDEPKRKPKPKKD
jgi:ATP-dependent RNA helicase DeaD